MKRFTYLCLLILFTSSVSGQTLIATVTGNIVPYFSNILGTYDRSLCSTTQGQPSCSSLGYSTPPSAQARWGVPQSGNKNSGLGFEPLASFTVSLYNSGTSSASTDFFLGNLTHFNFPITNAATGVTLNLQLSLRDTNNQQIGTNTYTYQFQIDETPNTGVCAYPSTVPCADKIFFTVGFDTTKSFTINNVNYTLQLLGFKETQYSGSTPVTYFISQENQASNAYLFGRLTLACPTVCQGGGSIYVDSNGNCVCSCANVPACPYPKIFNPDCSCGCRASTCVNGGTQTSNCSCQCPTNVCQSPKVPDANCNCVCPTNRCGCGSMNPSTCACDCGSCAPCQIQNTVLNSTCQCECPITTTTCKASRVNSIKDPDPSVCGCICDPAIAAGCSGNFVWNSASCTCVCPSNTCPNGQTLIAQNCSCGDCSPTGNWQKDPASGKCELCGISQENCTNFGNGTTQAVLDPTTCTCACNNLTCDIDLGLVKDENAFCSCRPCRAGECRCGNGRVEAGEQCDDITPSHPCCQNCQFTTSPCDDGNGCTTDYCNGNGTCIGTPKCAASTECRIISCLSAVGVCNTTNLPDGTACRGGYDFPNLCQRQCISGVCTENPIICTDADTTDCTYPTCNTNTGQCTGVAYESGNHTCSDGNQCTYSDVCDGAGVCSGTPVDCPETGNPCTEPVCYLGTCVERARTGSTIFCNADNDACTPNDYCSNGICVADTRTQCKDSEVCASYICNATSGSCDTVFNNNASCNDGNVCTEEDVCFNGDCKGVKTDRVAMLPQCGYVPTPVQNTPSTVPITIITVTLAAAIIGAIVGVAFLIKKVRSSRLLDPDTWNPDTFSSVGANPLYKGSIKTVDNMLYETK